MRKLLTILLILSALPLTAHADADLAAMSTDELRHLRDMVNLELASRTQAPGNTAAWTTPLARVELVSITRGTTNDGAACVELILSYTNMSDSIDKFRASHWVNLYQSGVEQETTSYFNGVLVDVDSWGRKAQPGATLLMQWVFLLPDSSATVDIEVEYRHQSQTDSAGLVTVALPE